MNSTHIPVYLLRSIEKGKCVLFVGAGVSCEAGLPSASKLSEILACEADYPKTFPCSLLDIGQYYEEKFGRASLMKRLYETLKPGRPSETHKLIAALSSKFRLIITTNYDSLLEDAFTEIGYPYYNVKEARDITNTPVETELPIIFKIHGDLDTKNIILTREDYYHYLEKSLKSTLGAYLKAQLAMGTFLFVGYSLRDYNFVLLYESVRDELKDYMPKGFAVMPSPDPVESSLWNKRGIELIDTTAGDLFEQISQSLMTPGTVQVFLSYSFEDENYAKCISKILEANGIKTFYPSRDISLGDNIVEKINRGMLQSQIFVAILSPKSVKSEWVIKELAAIQSLHRRRIIPVLVGDCKIPDNIKHIKYLDARKDFSSALEYLVEAIRKD